MTTSDIFSANQILTVEIANTLIGKTIAVTNGEYSSNRTTVRICKVLGTETEFEAAKRQPQEKYGNVQAMWIAEKNERSIERAKTRIKLIYTGENPYATCEDSTHCLPAGTFFGSDADREIYYVVVPDKMEQLELTRVYHQKRDGRICDFLTNLSLEEVIEKNDWLKEADRKIIKTRSEIVIINDNPKCRETIKENGILSYEYLDEKPDAYANERAWNEMYQKHTGNILPKGGILK